MGRNPSGGNSLRCGIPIDGVFLVGIPLGRSSLGGIPVREVSWEVSRGDEFLVGNPRREESQREGIPCEEFRRKKCPGRNPAWAPITHMLYHGLSHGTYIII